MNMKNIIGMAAVLAVAVACEKPVTDISHDEISLDLSVWETCMDCCGGDVQVAVATNGEDWDFGSCPEWVELSASGNTLGISIMENEDAASRKGYVYVTAYNGGQSVKDSILVIQSGCSSMDLSAGGTANSYIVSTGSDCYFNATVKGNGNTEAQGSVRNYIDRYGAEIAGAVKAELLWEATLNGSLSDDKRIMDGSPVLCGGKVFFKTGTSEGNAVIAVKDVHGEILWSWHIWVTDAEIQDVETSAGAVFMDRNLGACSVQPGDVESRGLEYQWGRKDPLLPSFMTYEDCALLTDYDYETNNYNVGDGTGTWDYALPMQHTDNVYGNIGQAVANPMSFIMSNFYIEPVKPYDWFCINPDGEAYLWGASMDKTIFDPCPAGYAIPSASAWTAGEDFSESNFGIASVASGLFWPFTGYRITYSGNHDGTDEFGRYWTRDMCAEEGAEGRSIYMQASASSGIELPFEGRATTMAVRCVRM